MGGQGEAVALVGDSIVGVAPVAIVARERSALAQIPPRRAAEAAGSAGPPEPRHPDPSAGREPARGGAVLFHDAHDLVSEDQRQLRVGQLTGLDVEIGAAHAAGLDPEEDLVGPGPRSLDPTGHDRFAGPLQHHRVHRIGHADLLPRFTVSSERPTYRGAQDHSS